MNTGGGLDNLILVVQALSSSGKDLKLIQGPKIKSLNM